jgi:hypothetical protein
MIISHTMPVGFEEGTNDPTCRPCSGLFRAIPYRGRKPWHRKRREAVCGGSLPRAQRRFCPPCNPSEEGYPSSRRGRQRRYGSLLTRSWIPLHRVHLIVNAGANIGDETIRFRHFHPEATIIALEPHAGNFHVLKKNVEADPNTVAIPKVCGLMNARSSSLPAAPTSVSR